MKKILNALGYIYYRLAYFEESCWYEGHICNSGGLIGCSLALYVVNAFHYLGYEIPIPLFYKFILVFIPGFIGLLAADIFMKERYKCLKEKYKQDNNRTLKGWIIAFVLAFPLILLLTWIEMPE